MKSSATAFKLERNLVQDLSKVVTPPKETVEAQHIIKHEGKPIYCADIFLQKGCKALKMKGPAVIEVKKTPLFDTVLQQKNAFERIKRCGIKTFILAVDEENAVQVLTVSYEEPLGVAVVLFSGLDDSAKLTEIVCVLYSDADTVTELEGGIDIQTTEETVNAVYDEIDSWFTGLQAVELGDHLALPLYPALRDEEETISRAVLYLYEDGEGYNAATHYVGTTDCGVNVLQYLYLDAAEAEALLAE